jgi:hypothetical protein
MDLGDVCRYLKVMGTSIEMSMGASAFQDLRTKTIFLVSVVVGQGREAFVTFIISLLLSLHFPYALTQRGNSILQGP